jgi:hypothetical protein
VVHPAASAGILAEEPAYDLIELLFFAYRDFIGELFRTSRSSTPAEAYEWTSQRLDPAVDQVEHLRQRGVVAEVVSPASFRHYQIGVAPVEI